MRWILRCAAAAAVLAASNTALATPPDFDGERGVEVHASFGVGSMFNNSERSFQSEMEATAVGDPRLAVTAGFNFRLGAGYRFLPYLSAGVSFQIQTLGAAQLRIPLPPSWTLGAGAWSLGAYARLYPLALMGGAYSMRRVNFSSSDQSARRFEPWVGLGVEVHTLWRSIDEQSTTFHTDWLNRSIGLPITAGFDVRVIPALAVGVSAGVTPTFSMGVDKRDRAERGGNITEASTSYAPAAGVNAAWFIGLGARYTFTF